MKQAVCSDVSVIIGWHTALKRSSTIDSPKYLQKDRAFIAAQCVQVTLMYTDKFFDASEIRALKEDAESEPEPPPKEEAAEATTKQASTPWRTPKINPEKVAARITELAKEHRPEPPPVQLRTVLQIANRGALWMPACMG